ncbi:MAG: sigma-70 family RNA polymerase sigma factor [Alphaproteobacteria bacterium]|jgi:RNA polymerase sigma-70 factor, ECF subfamily|uniref:RNA polymerase sigma factor n=1 Tax=Maricaulis alexandrii TaxID=2570354 RepID=UPI001108A6D2|nr:sigma-70 family RNA polymerase sigma factor [Maricaulis alexandrii]MCR9266349.1 sigma-70 family RNA polymerase sigma factor [Alphaproteobacteria bacterium]
MQAPDEELVALVVATKNPAAFGELVRRHQGIVRGMLQRMCRNHALADDLAQDTFIRAYEKIGSFKGTGSFKSWMCSIAYTEFLKSARKRKSTERVMEKFQTGVEDTEAPRDMGSVVDLDRGLATLKEEERTLVVMCYSCGMSHSEAAEATGMPLGTVKSHVNRGRAKLQAYFQEAEVMAS